MGNPSSPRLKVSHFIWDFQFEWCLYNTSNVTYCFYSQFFYLNKFPLFFLPKFCFFYSRLSKLCLFYFLLSIFMVNVFSYCVSSSYLLHAFMNSDFLLALLDLKAEKWLHFCSLGWSLIFSDFQIFTVLNNEPVYQNSKMIQHPKSHPENSIIQITL
jgi:hypothetical protein